MCFNQHIIVDRDFFWFLKISNNEFLFKSELQEIMDQKFERMDRMKNNQPSQINYNHQGVRGKFTIPSFVGFYDGEKYFD